MLQSRVVFLSILALALTACGGASNGGGGSAPTPLSPEQKVKVSAVAQSMDVATQAAQNAGGVSLMSVNIPINKDEKAKEMSKSLQDGSCHFEDTMPAKSGSSPADGEFHFVVSGDQCPIALMSSVSFATVQGPNSIEMNVGIVQTYRVSNAQYGEMNDVTGMDISGAFHMQGSPNGVSGSGRFTGYVQSQEFGKLGIDISATVSGGRGSVTSVLSISVAFPDFTATGRVVSTQDSNGVVSISYSVNGQTVTEKDFREIFGSNFSSNPGGNGLL